MRLTTRQICEIYTRLQNLEQSPDLFCNLLHPSVRWVTKWWTGNGAIEIEANLRQMLAHKQSGLSHVELVSGHHNEDDRHIDCTVAIPLAEPEKHDTRTMFQTDGGHITGIFTYSEWLNRNWPHPYRATRKLAELIAWKIPIAQISEKPQVLLWPDSDRNLDSANSRDNPESLQHVQLQLANALDAAPKGAEIPGIDFE